MWAAPALALCARVAICVGGTAQAAVDVDRRCVQRLHAHTRTRSFEHTTGSWSCSTVRGWILNLASLLSWLPLPCCPCTRQARSHWGLYGSTATTDSKDTSPQKQTFGGNVWGVLIGAVVRDGCCGRGGCCKGGAPCCRACPPKSRTRVRVCVCVCVRAPTPP